LRRRRGQQGLSLFATGLLAIAVIGILTYLGFAKAIPFKSHYEISAVFKSANNLKPNSPVRIAGVNVGKVTKVEHTEPGSETATVTMRFQDKGLPVHEDATFKIRPRIFLEGNFFVDVQPGTPSAEIVDDGGVIPVNQTDTPVQLDQILTALQADTREDLKTLLKEYGDALDEGGAESFNDSIPYWKPAYRDSAIVSEASLGEVEHDLSKYVEHAGTVAAALDRSPQALKSLISDLNTTARALAREDDNLRAAVAELPRTLQAGRPALAALNSSFPGLRALARELRPGVRSSGPAIDAARPLVAQLRELMAEDELKGLVADLRPTVPALASLSAASVPLYKQVRLAAGCQNDVILPWSVDKIEDEAFPAHGKVFEEAPKPFGGLAGESRSGDANGQWFRVLTTGGTNLITLKPGVFATNALPINGTNPPKPTARPPLRSELDCETQQPPDLRTVPGIPPPQKQVDTSSPAYQKRLAAAHERFVKWARKQVKLEGLEKELDLTNLELLTKDKVEALLKGVKRP
jgi:virulence factor Mce-like protein